MLQAADGADALKLIDRHGPPDLVLTDVLMPSIGGAELIRKPFSLDDLVHRVAVALSHLDTR